MATRGNTSNNSNRTASRRPLWELYDTYEDSDQAAKFRHSDMPIYTGEPPNNNSKGWVHEVQAVLEASRYRPASWVSLAVMQLREEAAAWWRSLDTDPWRMIWSEFTEMFLAQFLPPTYPRGPSTRIPDAVARFATQHAIFDQIVENWE